MFFHEVSIETFMADPAGSTPRFIKSHGGQIWAGPLEPIGRPWKGGRSAVTEEDLVCLFTASIIGIPSKIEFLWNWWMLWVYALIWICLMDALDHFFEWYIWWWMLDGMLSQLGFWWLWTSKKKHLPSHGIIVLHANLFEIQWVDTGIVGFSINTRYFNRDQVCFFSLHLRGKMQRPHILTSNDGEDWNHPNFFLLLTDLWFLPTTKHTGLTHNSQTLGCKTSKIDMKGMKRIWYLGNLNRASMIADQSMEWDANFSYICLLSWSPPNLFFINQC